MGCTGAGMMIPGRAGPMDLRWMSLCLGRGQLSGSQTEPIYSET